MLFTKKELANYVGRCPSWATNAVANGIIEDGDVLIGRRRFYSQVAADRAKALVSDLDSLKPKDKIKTDTKVDLGIDIEALIVNAVREAMKAKESN